MKIGIVIVSWNVKDRLQECLASLRRTAEEHNWKVIVVDNASQDGSVAMLKAHVPWVTLIANNSNVGFATACNQGVHALRSDYYLFLNPDTKIKKDSLINLLRYADEHSDVAVVAPQLRYPDNTWQPSVRTDPTLLSQLFILLKLRTFVPQLPWLRNYFQTNIESDKIQVVQQVMGAALLVRSSVFRQLHGFDEKFYLWFEEVDLCRRIRTAGYKIVYYPKSVIVHHKGSSFGQKSILRKQLIFNHSLLFYFRKHHTHAEVIVLLLIMPVSILLATLQQFLNIHVKD